MSIATITAYRTNAARPSVRQARKCRNAQKSSGFWASGTYGHCIKDHVLIDPAAGSGNFLTETYLCLRRLENRVIRELEGGQGVLAFADPIKVRISQFYGIEINDFAVTVAKTALWIAESQMMRETEGIVHMDLDFLPLKTNANIVEGNALRINWNDVVDRKRLNYCYGNPPFIGYTYQTPEQKSDLQNVENSIGKNIDYVAGWYYKAAQYIQNTQIQVAFVSTNSITQGEQVEAVWKTLIEKYNIEICFAYRTFVWDSEASQKAQVHCVIIGFAVNGTFSKQKKIIFEDQEQEVFNINPYLVDAETIFIEKRSKPLCDVPEISKGSQPTDGGNLIIAGTGYEDFIKCEPNAKPFINVFLGADEFLNGKRRYCLWLTEAPPSVLKLSKVRERVRGVKEFREKSKKAATRKWAEQPALFTENRQPKSNYIAIPEVSSGGRRYIPIGFLSPEIICSNKLQLIPDAGLYEFGILTSNVHMAWMRVVCGRLKSDYDYSAKIVYNNFPWPSPNATQKILIEQAGQGILDARALYSDSTLAELYDPLSMPIELRKAHQKNDAAVMKAYGMPIKETDEAACVAWLMRLYQEKVKELEKTSR